MAELAIGNVTRLMRYPVKSMAGESLEQTRIEPYGIYGDRGYALVDETKEGWSRYVTARQIPRLLAYRAKLDEETPPVEGRLPGVTVAAPDGRLHGWNEKLLEELLALSNRAFTLHASEPDDKQYNVDSGSILIVAEQTINRLSSLRGKDVDWLRFRPNIVAAFREGIFEREQELAGRRLRIGEAVFRVEEPCERCSMITIDPDTLEKDPELLRTVHRELGLEFGLYASVVRPGTVKRGDAVYEAD